MDKKALIKKFEDLIAADLKVLTESALRAHEAATHAESKAEDQYDTRGLEASYLAGAQSRRASELEALLNTYRYIDIKNFSANESIASTAVIELASEDGKHSSYLMMPSGGGLHVEYEKKKITIVSPASPLGSGLLGKKVGDQVTVVIQNVAKDYDIVGVE